jgi:hypothetical protein
LIGEGGGPYGTVSGLLDVVFVGALDYVEATVIQHRLQSLIANNLMKTEGLVHLGFDSNIDTDTRASLDILVRRVLDISDDIFDFHI